MVFKFSATAELFLLLCWLNSVGEQPLSLWFVFGADFFMKDTHYVQLQSATPHSVARLICFGPGEKKVSNAHFVLSFL